MTGASRRSSGISFRKVKSILPELLASGFVSGTINGKVNGYVNGLVDGEVNVTLVSGNAQTEAGGQPPEELQPPAETEPAEQEGGDHHE